MANNHDLKITNSLRFIAKSSVIVFISIALSKVFSYLFRIIIVRNFGAEEYGLFSLAFIFFCLFVAISSLGLAEGVLRFVSFYRGRKQQNKINYLIKYSLITAFISGLIMGIILFFSSEFVSINIIHNIRLIPYLKIFSLLIPLSVLANILLFTLRAYEKVNLYSFSINVFQTFIRVAFLVLFIFVGLSSNPIIASFIVSTVLLLILSFLLCKYKLPGIFVKLSISKNEKRQLSSELFAYSWPIIFVSIIANLFYWTDSLMLGYLNSAYDVGIYNVAIALASILGIAPELFMQLFFPIINFEYSKNNIVFIREISKQIGKWIFIINLPVFYLMIFFPEIIIGILFGKEYFLVKTVLRLLSIGAFFGAFFNISNNLLSMLGKSKLILMNFGIFTVFNIILNYFLIQKYGIAGAAFSTVLSFFFITLFSVLQVRKLSGILPFRRKMLRVLLVSLILLIPALIIKSYVNFSLIGIFVLFVIFSILYIFLLYFSGCLDKNDLEIYNAVKRRLYQKEV